MAKSKVISNKSASFAKGGKTKMFGKQHAGQEAPGTSAQRDKNSGGKFGKGGKTKMFGKQTAGPQRPGRAGQE